MASGRKQTGIGPWPIGCQARPWLQRLGSEAFAARLPEVMEIIAGLGFAGFETGLACLPLDDPALFTAASARANGLVLAGAHAGGRWWDPAEAERIPALVEQTRRLPDLRCRRLVVSMQSPSASVTDDHLAHIAGSLTRLGEACRDAAGVEVVFHNHAAELADGGRIIAAIADRCPPDAINLGADLGWVAHGGMDVGAFFDRFGSRVAYLHVRDVTDTGPGGGFIEVGQGMLDHGAIFRTLAAAGYDGWLVAESEFTDAWRGATDPQETARRQLDGLRRGLSAAGFGESRAGLTP